MADYTASSAAPFIPEIWANMALKILRPNFVMAGLVTKDTDLATFQVGNTLSIPYPGTFSANSITDGNAVQLQVPTSTSATVTLNKHYEATILVTDIARAQALPYLMESLLNSQVAPIAQQVETDIIGLYSSLPTPTIGTAGTSLTSTTLRSINKLFTDQEVPHGNRHLLISTKDTANLMADSTLQQFFAYSQPGTVENGLISSNLYGLQVHESQLVPAVGSSPVTTNNIAFDPGAFILASRALPEAPAGTGAVTTVVTDPVSGLVLRCTMSYNPNYLGVQVTIDVLYGVAVIFPAKAFVALS